MVVFLQVFFFNRDLSTHLNVHDHHHDYSHSAHAVENLNDHSVFPHLCYDVSEGHGLSQQHATLMGMFDLSPYSTTQLGQRFISPVTGSISIEVIFASQNVFMQHPDSVDVFRPLRRRPTHRMATTHQQAQSIMNLSIHAFAHCTACPSRTNATPMSQMQTQTLYKLTVNDRPGCLGKLPSNLTNMNGQIILQVCMTILIKVIHTRQQDQTLLYSHNVENEHLEAPNVSQDFKWKSVPQSVTVVATVMMGIVFLLHSHIMHLPSHGDNISSC